MLEQRLKDKNDILTDYLGRIETETGVYKKKDNNMLKITLLDQSCISIVLTLWEKIAFSFKEENAIGKLLAVSSAKVTEFQATRTHRQGKARQGTHSRLQLTQVCGEMGMTIADLKMKQPEEFKNKRYTCEAKIKDYEAYRGWFSAKCPDSSCTKSLYKEKGTLICEDGHQFRSPNYMQAFTYKDSPKQNSYNVNYHLQCFTLT